jgi:5-methylcytosine-specific restriction protein A
MKKTKIQVSSDIAQVFRSGEAQKAWDLVIQIAGQSGKGIEDSELSADCVPNDLAWEAPSLIQAFALTFDNRSLPPAKRSSADLILNTLESEAPANALVAFSLGELRAALFNLQRIWHDSDGEPDEKGVERLVAEIRQRFVQREAVWRGDALVASVDAYVSMMANEEAGKPNNQAQLVRALGLRFGRPGKDFMRRFGEISYVLAASGEAWILNLRGPTTLAVGEVEEISGALMNAKKNFGVPVGVITKAQIRAMRAMTDSEVLPGAPWPFYGDFAFTDDVVDSNTVALMEGPPPGVLHPQEVLTTVMTRARDDAVRAWVLRRANGQCECCSGDAPFMDKDGVPFLEVHHLRTLADLGSDRHTNAVAVCPNCHRRLHFGNDSEVLLGELYERVPELIPEHSNQES